MALKPTRHDPDVHPQRVAPSPLDPIKDRRSNLVGVDV